MAKDLGSLPRRFLLLVNLLAAVAAAVFVVGLYVAPDSLGGYDESTGVVGIRTRGNRPLEFAALAAGLLLIVDVLFLVYGRRPRTPLRHVVSDAPGGPVNVSRDALEAGLRAAGEALDQITRLRVAVEAGALKRIVVRAHFMCPESVPLQEASRLLRTVLGARFRELVRLPEGGKVDFEIEFVGFAGKLSRKAVAEPAEPPPEEASPFTGPQYPIDDEDPFQETRSS